MKTKFAVLAALLIVLGFGMIHGKSVFMEYLSIAMIGTGTSYLIYLILSSKKNDKDNA